MWDKEKVFPKTKSGKGKGHQSKSVQNCDLMDARLFTVSQKKKKKVGQNQGIKKYVIKVIVKLHTIKIKSQNKEESLL